MTQAGAAGMLALSVVSVSPAPAGTVHAQITTADAARYDPDESVFVPNFTGRINPFLVDTTWITVADDPRAITPTHEECWTVTRAHHGAFATYVDGVVLAPSGMPLSTTGSYPDDAAPVSSPTGSTILC